MAYNDITPNGTKGILKMEFFDVVTKLNPETNAPEIVSVWGTAHDDIECLHVALKEDNYNFISDLLATTIDTEGIVRVHQFVRGKEEAEKIAAGIRAITMFID